MGNSLGGRRKLVKVMKIDGETIKLKTPIQACEVVKDYPAGYVLLDSEAVKHFGIRAKPLEPHHQLKPMKIYFLVELPKFPEEKITRRVTSGIHMTAKDRLECLMLSRRAVSDLTGAAGPGPGPGRVKMRLPRAQVEKLMEESRDDGDVAEKILDLYVENSAAAELRPEDGGVRGNLKAREKRVRFDPFK